MSNKKSRFTKIHQYKEKITRKEFSTELKSIFESEGIFESRGILYKVETSQIKPLSSNESIQGFVTVKRNGEKIFKTGFAVRVNENLGKFIIKVVTNTTLKFNFISNDILTNINMGTRQLYHTKTNSDSVGILAGIKEIYYHYKPQVIHLRELHKDAVKRKCKIIYLAPYK